MFVLTGVVFIVASLIQWIPGDPVDLILGDLASIAEKAALRHQLGLDQSFFRRILEYFTNILHANFGTSFFYSKPVFELIGERFSSTASLATMGMIGAVVISIPFGVMGAVFKDSYLDRAGSTLAVLGICIPNFFLGPLLVLIFAIYLDWFPVSEKSNWQSYILPSLTLALALSAFLSRMTRNVMIEILSENYIRTARAKGVSPGLVIFKHGLRNALLPLTTILGLQFGVLLTGAIITEKIFDWPGMGGLMIEGIQNRDYPVVQGCVLVFAVIYITVNFFTDLLNAVIDPRIRRQSNV